MYTQTLPNLPGTSGSRAGVPRPRRGLPGLCFAFVLLQDPEVGPESNLFAFLFGFPSFFQYWLLRFDGDVVDGKKKRVSSGRGAAVLVCPKQPRCGFVPNFI